MANSSKVGWIILVLSAVFIIIPLLQGEYALIEQSTDMEAHTNIIDSFINGTPMPRLLYFGQVIVGAPLAALIILTRLSTDTIYVIFNFLVLIGVALTLYYVVKWLVGLRAAWLVVPVCIFATPSLLGLFKYGVIFDIINIGIILPWAIYFGVKWYVTTKKHYAVASLSLMLLYSVFHVTGLYLPFALTILVVVAIVYKVFVNRRYQLMPIGIFGIMIIPWYIVMVVVGVLSLTSEPSGGGIPFGGDNILGYGTVTPLQFTYQFLGISTAVLLAIAIAYYVGMRKRVRIGLEAKLFGLTLCCFAVPLIIGMFTNIFGASVRLASDLATIVALITVCLIGALLNSRKRFAIELFVVSSSIVAIGTAYTLSIWLFGGCSVV